MNRAVCTWGVVIAVGVLGRGVATAEPLPRFGVLVDAGVPDGGTAALVVRPLSWLRVSAGVSHNLIGPGVRGGITLVPLGTWVTPTLSASYGRYFERDANAAARTLSGDATLSSPALERFGYDYADAHVGLEFGQARATFFLHAGVARVTGQARNLGEISSDEPGGASVKFTEDPEVTVTALSARLGLIVYIL